MSLHLETIQSLFYLIKTFQLILTWALGYLHYTL